MRGALAIVALVTGCGRVNFDLPPANDGGGGDGGDDPTLVGYWRFDEASGNAAADASGHANNGTLVASPNWVAGKDGGALQFDGVSQYVDIPGSASLDHLAVKTITAWVMLPANPTHRGIVFGRDASLGCGYGLSIQPNNSILFRQCFAGDGDWQTAAGSVPVGSWHHVAVVYDDGSLTSTPTFYLDHAVASFTTIQTPAGPMEDDSLMPVSIAGNGVDTTEGLTGVVDDVRLYDRELLANEISALP